MEILLCIKDQKINDSLLAILKPFLCNDCQKRFPDEQTLQSHCQFSHAKSDHEERRLASRGAIIDPKQLSVKDLKKELAQMGLLVTGNKDILIKRLETALNKEL